MSPKVHLVIMRKVIPDIASENSEYDCATKFVAAQVLHIIKDPLFIARLIPNEKVFYAVSVLEKEVQAVTFGPFDLVNTNESSVRLILSS